MFPFSRLSSCLLLLLISTSSYSQIPDLNDSNYRVNTKTDIPDRLSIKVDLFKNPISNVIYIKSFQEPKSIELMTTNGELIYSARHGNELSLGQLDKGTYKVRIKFDSGETIKTFQH